MYTIDNGRMKTLTKESSGLHSLSKFFHSNKMISATHHQNLESLLGNLVFILTNTFKKNMLLLPKDVKFHHLLSLLGLVEDCSIHILTCKIFPNHSKRFTSALGNWPKTKKYRHS